mmetsp:Transcript_37061/g.105974  ORF Transcript_37061/g.105974 Transcript_37061/m.105974 type:complete len:334 (+) Transcript_37061:1932-2933(+)
MGLEGLNAHVLDEGQLLRRREAREDGRATQARQQKVPLQQPRAQVLAQHGLQLAIAHAEQLARGDRAHRRATRLIVEQRALTEAVTVPKQLDHLIPDEDLELALFHQVHAPGDVALTNNLDPRPVDLGQECLRQAVFLLRRKPIEERNGIHKGPVLLVVALSVGTDHRTERTTIASPEPHIRPGHNGGIPWTVVEQCKAAEGSAGRQPIHLVAIYKHTELTLMDGEKEIARLALPDYCLPGTEAEEFHGAHNPLHVPCRERGAQLIAHDRTPQQPLGLGALCAGLPVREHEPDLFRGGRGLDLQAPHAPERRDRAPPVQDAVVGVFLHDPRKL